MPLLLSLERFNEASLHAALERVHEDTSFPGTGHIDDELPPLTTPLLRLMSVASPSPSPPMHRQDAGRAVQCLALGMIVENTQAAESTPPVDGSNATAPSCPLSPIIRC